MRRCPCASDGRVARPSPLGAGGGIRAEAPLGTRFRALARVLPGILGMVLLGVLAGAGPLAPDGLVAQAPPETRRVPATVRPPAPPPPTAVSSPRQVAPPAGFAVPQATAFPPGVALPGRGPGWLGLRLQVVYVTVDGARGGLQAWELIPLSGHVQVEEVIRGGPAEGAGVRPGDRLLQIQGREALRLLERGGLGVFEPGERIPLLLERDGRRFTLPVVAAMHPEYEATARAVEVARLRVDSIGAVVARELERVREEVEVRTLTGAQVVIHRSEVEGGVRPSVATRFDGAGTRGRNDGEAVVLVRPSFQIDSLMRLRSDRAGASAPPSGPQTVVRFHSLQGDSWAGATLSSPSRPWTSSVDGRESLAESPAMALRFYGDRTLLGAQVTPLNAGLARYFGVREGVLVTDVVEGAPADQAGIRSGDVIIALRWRTGRVDRVTELTTLRGAVTEGWRAPPLHARVVREGRTLEVEIPTGW